MGRRFKYCGNMYRVTEKPGISMDNGSIRIDHWYLNLICIRGSYSGQLWHKDNIEWID